MPDSKCQPYYLDFLFREEFGEARFGSACFIRVDDVCFGSFVDGRKYLRQHFFGRSLAHLFDQITQFFFRGRPFDGPLTIVTQLFDCSFCQWHTPQYSVFCSRRQAVLVL